MRYSFEQVVDSIDACENDPIEFVELVDCIVEGLLACWWLYADCGEGDNVCAEFC